MFKFSFDMSSNSLGVSEIQKIDTNIIGATIVRATFT